MRVVVSAVMVAALVAPAAAKGKGAALSMSYKKAPVQDVLRVIGAVGKFNVVFADRVDAKIDVEYNTVPWDDVLREVVAQAKLAYVMEGNIAIVGTQASIDARKAQTAKAKPKASGPRVTLDLVGASAKEAAGLLAIATGSAFELDGGDDATLLLKNVPLSVAKDMLALHTHATPVAKPAKPALVRAKGACAAPTLPVGELEIVGIAGVGTKRWAMLGTKTSAETFVIAAADCVGTERLAVKLVGDGFVDLDGNTTLRQHPLR